MSEYRTDRIWEEYYERCCYWSHNMTLGICYNRLYMKYIQCLVLCSIYRICSADLTNIEDNLGLPGPDDVTQVTNNLR